MGIIDDQLRQRQQADDDAFAEAMASLADVIMGENLAGHFRDNARQAKDAIGEILRYYHLSAPELPDSSQRLSDQLDHLLRPHGILYREVRLESGWYRDASGPMLGFLREESVPVPLLPRGFSGYAYLDPATGRWTRLNKRTEGLLEPQAVCFYRTFPAKKLGIGDLLAFATHSARPSDLAALVLAVAMATAIGVLVPYINDIIYSKVLGSQSVQLLLAAFSFLVCVMLSRVLLQTVQRLAIQRLTGRLLTAFQAAGMARMLCLPPSFFRQFGSGDLASRMQSIGELCATLVEAVLAIGLTSVFSLVYVFQMFQYGPRLVGPGLAVIGVTLLISVVGTVADARVSTRMMQQRAKEQGTAYALIDGLQKIRLAGAERRAFARWAREYAPMARLQYDPPLVIHVTRVLAACMGLIGTLAIYFFAIRTRVPLPDYFAFQASYGLVMGAFTSLVSAAGRFASIVPMFNLVSPVLEEVPEEGIGATQVDKLSGGVSLEHVTFAYGEKGPKVLDDLSLDVRPGEYVAIVGRTGCGKSTLLRLLLGFEKPQGGAVYYDNRDLATLDPASVRRRLGVVMQDGKLFSGDIFSNITISAPWATLQDAWRAAEMAGIADDIRSMPMGMHTVISEGSGGISGGQRQRLLIARAIAAMPDILLFDEATSALDNLTQKTVTQSLGKLGCTRIIVAHRLSTIRDCDRILVLDNGRIVEAGTYDELSRAGGLFTDLVRRQQLDTPGEDG